MRIALRGNKFTFVNTVFAETWWNVTAMNNKNRLYVWNKDGAEGTSKAKGPDDGLRVTCLSLDQPQVQGQAKPNREMQESQERWSRDMGSVVRDCSSLGCDMGLTLCFASPGGRTSYASRMAGCATWRQRSSASCPPTRRRTSSPSPSTRMSSHLGRWPTLAFKSPSPGRGAIPKGFFCAFGRDRAPACGGEGGWISE